MCRVFLFLGGVPILVFLLVGCGRGGSASNPDREEAVRRTLKPPNGLHLSNTEETPLAHPFLIRPVSMAVHEDGTIFVADNNAHRVFRLAPKSSFLTPGVPRPERGERLEWPNRIRVVRDSLYVADQLGIRTLPLGDGPSNTIKSFYHVNDFAIRPDGTLLILSGIEPEVTSATAVIELTKEGFRKNSFGHAYASSASSGAMANLWNSGFIGLAGNAFVVGYRHRPLLVVKNGEDDMQEIALPHPASDELAKLDRDLSFVHPDPSRYRLSKYVAGVSASSDRFYILLDTPFIMIHEYDWLRSRCRTYTSLTSRPIQFFFGIEMDPLESDTFIIGVGYSQREFSILRFRKTSPEQP